MTPQELSAIRLTRIVDGITLRARVSPTVWNYHGYPLQLIVTADELHGQYVTRRQQHITAPDATEADVLALFDAVALRPCDACGGPSFDPVTVNACDYGLCYRCTLARARAELDQAQAAERDDLAAQDAREKARGATHRVTAWIHPGAGDDHCIDIYTTGEPTQGYITRILKRKGSTVTTDYTVVPLHKGTQNHDRDH